MSWKETEEDKTDSRFVPNGGQKKRKHGGTYQAFVCHRSGKYNCQGHGLRHMKVQGSVKIGTVCPARMFVTTSPAGN